MWYVSQHAATRGELETYNSFVLKRKELQSVQIWCKSVKWTLNTWGRKSFYYLAWHCSGATETSHLPLPVQALKSVQVWSKLVSNEGHFTVKAETVFRPYLASHCRGLTVVPHLPFSAHALQTFQVWSKSVSNEGHFSFDAGTVFRPYLISHCSRLTEASESVSNERHFTLGAEKV
jgi:hypothetical protein